MVKKDLSTRDNDYLGGRRLQFNPTQCSHSFSLILSLVNGMSQKYLNQLSPDSFAYPSFSPFLLS